MKQIRFMRCFLVLVFLGVVVVCHIVISAEP